MSGVSHDYSPILFADQGLEAASRQNLGITGPKPPSELRAQLEQASRAWRVAQQSLARHNEAQPA